jgi:hypothetical protein
MACCDACCFSVTVLEEKRPLLRRDCVLRLTAGDNGVLLLALFLDTVQTQQRFLNSLRRIHRAFTKYLHYACCHRAKYSNQGINSEPADC